MQAAYYHDFKPYPYHYGYSYSASFIVNTLFELTEEEVKALEEENQSVAKYNQVSFTHNNAEYQRVKTELLQGLKDLGVQYIAKTTKNGDKYYPHINKLLDSLVSPYRLPNKPRIDFSGFENKQVIIESDLGYLAFRPRMVNNDLMSLWRDMHAQYDFFVKKSKKYDIAVKFCKDNSLDPGTNPIQVSEDFAKEKFITENLIDGKEFPIKECECGIHIVGQPRCLCGNVRISYSIDGDIESGFYIYPEIF